MSITVYKGLGTKVTLDTAAGTITLEHDRSAGKARFADPHHVLALADLERVEEVTKRLRVDLRLVVAGTTPTGPVVDDPLAFRTGMRSHKPVVALVDAELDRIRRGEPPQVPTARPLLKPSAALRASANARTEGEGPGATTVYRAKNSTVTLDTATGTLTIDHQEGARPARLKHPHQVIQLGEVMRVENTATLRKTYVRVVVRGVPAAKNPMDDPRGFTPTYSEDVNAFVTLVWAAVMDVRRSDPSAVQVGPGGRMRQADNPLDAHVSRDAGGGGGGGFFGSLFGGGAGGGGLG